MGRDEQLPTNDGQEIANLNTLNFSAIASRDPSQMELLLKSCVEDGFFFLDFLNDDAGRILEDVQDIYVFMRDYFGQPLEVKMNDFRGGSQRG